MADYLLGIDNGATVSKVVIFDLHGQCDPDRQRADGRALPAAGLG